ncbi:G-type lectin S-receptor-like serine/threonine-protein kinase At4g27290 isoform X2 [Ziziphus jujuba]|uniref:Receptor-like serine/threonine-protein kinase n=1 Tax=Ziziphus jujuba TaxID=326968 RepID=A0ABM3I3U4_ZIZJJ|nr:G-type lectin S-receptor-like serine/threonine-protein kinase At4g27290 isoform X2 [Ziziphus jujuba]
MLMDAIHLLSIFYALVFLQTLSIFCGTADDTMTSNQSITDGDKTLVSSGQSFELGFFAPGKSKNRYLGIWYKTTPDVVVWVANRDNPLTDSHGQLTITNHGNLLLLNRTGFLVWSSNTSMVTKDPVARLLESGNLVVQEKNREADSEIYAWQSFDYPTDTSLAGMKIGWDLKTGLERYLTSWKSADDPSTGEFTLHMDIKGMPQIVVYSGTSRTLRSGLWNGVMFTGMYVNGDPVYESIFVFDENESYYMFKPKVNKDEVTRLRLSNSGNLERLVMHNTEWTTMSSMPYELCDRYGYCGANGVCRINGDPICDCLKGFTPKSQQEWEVLNWSNGCVRKTPLDCKNGDDFVKLVGVKLPDLLEFWLNKSMSLQECKEMCLKNCSCAAYANSDIREGGSGCLMWFGNLVDVRELRVKDTEQDIYLRLPKSELKSINGKRKLNTILIVSTTSCSGMFVMALVIWCIFWRKRTNGRGGFGPVFKGKLSTGQEIAVKRLSKDSGQGFKEFMNEVNLIAKLQHRNLVALLGCCIQGEERILIYEYMPSKSLDYFIFDDQRISLIGWRKRFDIVKGIARGLLYLHRDSKLQIVHRDLKASNILLDINLNPKISDFGLARIVEDDEKEATTRIVIGTYGYMSPEYAIDGKFSVKSDVFSFGVLLLEIISGKRNRKFIHPNHDHNLLGHAWLLWNEDRALNLMDASFGDSSDECQLLRCIQVGLLCVQKFSHDRPTMASVVFMLENEGAVLPQPKEPGFFMERSSNEESSSKLRNEESGSQNAVTLTKLNGR